MLDHKDNYEIKYHEGRWFVFLKGHDDPIKCAHFGSRIEAEIGLDKEIAYWNIRNENNVT